MTARSPAARLLAGIVVPLIVGIVLTILTGFLANPVQVARPSENREAWIEAFGWPVPYGFSGINAMALADAYLDRPDQEFRTARFLLDILFWTVLSGLAIRFSRRAKEGNA